MQQKTKNGLWLGWALATLIGYAVGALLALLVAVPLAYSAPAAWLANAAGGALIGGVLGVAQWLVLRRRTRIAAGWWVLASLLGGLLGLALGSALGDLLAPALVPPPADREAAARMIPLSAALSSGVSGLLFGLLLGGAQWFALRLPWRRAGWWLAANSLGWMLGLALGAAAAIPVGVIGGMLITGLVAGLITGAAMQGSDLPLH